MPGCSAYGCTSSTEKGFVMKVFPRDPALRKLWTNEVKRLNWKPTNYSYLCEVHFKDDMWEKVRVDGKKKLRANAVPTLFSFSAAPVRREAVDHSSTKSELQEPPSLTNVAETGLVEPGKVSSDTSETSLDDGDRKDREMRELQRKVENYDRRYKMLLFKNVAYRRQVGMYRNKVKKLEAQLTNDKCQSKVLLKRILHEDQIRALSRRSTKFMAWTSATINKALRLRLLCGPGGYEELMKQNMPLPSVRTLQRRLQHLTCESGILDYLNIQSESFKQVDGTLES